MSPFLMPSKPDQQAQQRLSCDPALEFGLLNQRGAAVEF
jgi:hypothetical protein